jgi:hypothetical protein
MPGWPNPERPGEPADPARPWHWVTRAGDAGGTPLPIGWNGALRQWLVWDGAPISPEEAAQRFAYVGPCQTPAETKALVAEAAEGAASKELRGYAGMAAAAANRPELPPAMMLRKHAIMANIGVFIGTAVTILYLAEWIIGVQPAR